jgi:hypothetical protein
MADEKPNPLTTRDFSRVILTLETVLVPEDKLSPSPSLQDGLDSETEMDLRILGCELIQSSGVLLKLPQVRRHFEIFNNLIIGLFFFSLKLVSG